MTEKITSGTEIGPYRVLREIGAGGFAVVYAVQTASGEQFALKMMSAGDPAEDEERRERFRREYELLSGHTHPNLVRAFAWGEHEGVPYFSLELLTGTTIGKYLLGDDHPLKVAKGAVGVISGGPRDGRAPSREYQIVWAKLMIQAGAALCEIHRNGQVHRDLSLRNVMVNDAGAVKLVDFGLGVDLTAMLTEASRLTETGQVMGNLAMVSPEGLDGWKQIVPQSDMYSLGLLGFMLLSGEHPYKVRTMREFWRAHREATPRQLSEMVQGDFPAGLEALVNSTLAKRWENRPTPYDWVVELGRMYGLEEYQQRRVPPTAGNYLSPWAAFVGRSKQVAQVEKRVETGLPGPVLVAGGRGMGKTRFLEELSKLKGRVGLYWHSDCALPPAAMMRTVLGNKRIRELDGNALLDKLGRKFHDREHKEGEMADSASVSSVVNNSGVGANEAITRESQHREHGEHKEGERADSGSVSSVSSVVNNSGVGANEATTEEEELPQVENMLVALCERGRTVTRGIWLVDNVHRLDAAWLEPVRAWIEAVAKHMVCVLTYDPECENEEVSTLLAKIRGLPRCEETSLEPLDVREVDRVVVSLLGLRRRAKHRVLIDKLHTKTRGNPGGLMRVIAEELFGKHKIIKRGDNGAWQFDGQEL